MGSAGRADIHVGHSGEGETVGALNSVGGALTTLGTVAAGAAIAGLAAVTISGFKAAATFEMMQLSLQSLSAREILNSGAASDMASAFDMAKGKAAELFSWVRQLAIQSPFSAEGVAKAFQTAEAYGFTADMAKRLTQATIDFASATGQSESAMNSISLALGQIQAKGRLMAQEILQLTNVGVPALQYLAQHFGKTTAEITKMTERGLIPAKDAVEAITKGMETDFAGAAARTQNTLQGLTSTLGDLWQMSTSSLLGGIFKGAAPLVAQFSGLLQSEGLPALERWGASAGNAASKVAIVLGGAFANLRAGMPVLDLLGRLFPQVFSPEIKAAIESIGGSLGKIGEALSPAVAGFITGIGDALKASFGENGALIVDNITTAFSGLATFFQTNGPTIAAAAQLLGTTLGAAIGGIATIISGLAASLGQLLAGDFNGALNTLGNSLTGFANGVSQAFGGVNFSAVLATWGGILSNAGTIISATAANAVAAASIWASSVLGAIVGGVSSIPGSIAGFISQGIAAVEALVGRAAGVGGSLAQGIAKGIVGAAGAVVGAMVGVVQDAIAAAWAAAKGASPSKIMIGFGSDVLMAGMALGIMNGAATAVDAMQTATTMAMQPAQTGVSMTGTQIRNSSQNTYHVNIQAASGDHLTDLMAQAQQLQGDV